FKCEAQWSNGPVRAELSLDARARIAEGQTLDVRGKLRSGDDVQVEQLTVASKWAPALQVKGSLPFSVLPSRSNGWLRADGQRPLDLRATMENVEGFSWPVESRGLVRVIAPKLELVAAGTLDKPSASLAVGPFGAEWRVGTNGGPVVRVDGVRCDAVVLPD